MLSREAVVARQRFVLVSTWWSAVSRVGDLASGSALCLGE